MTITMSNAAAIASVLIKLRCETLGSISSATDIRSANLSVWLRGKEQVISQQRVTKLLDYLGIGSGKLAPTQIHSWRLQGESQSLNTVLNCLLTDEERAKSIVLANGRDGFLQTKYLGVWQKKEWVWVCLIIESGLTRAPDVSAKALGFKQELILSVDLTKLPSTESTSVKETLEKAILDATATNDEKLVGINELQETLSKLLDSGISPKTITELLVSNFQKKQR